MKIALNIVIAILTVCAVILAIAGKPTPGQVNTNVVLLAPAAFLGLLDVLFILWRLLA